MRLIPVSKEKRDNLFRNVSMINKTAAEKGIWWIPYCKAERGKIWNITCSEFLCTFRRIVACNFAAYCIPYIITRPTINTQNTFTYGSPLSKVSCIVINISCLWLRVSECLLPKPHRMLKYENNNDFYLHVSKSYVLNVLSVRTHEFYWHTKYSISIFLPRV